MATQRPIIAILGADGVPDPTNLDEISDLATIRPCTAQTLPTALTGADVLLVWDFFSRALKDNWGPATADLRWVHVCAAGVDSLLFDDLRSSPIVVTNAAGVFDRPIAEFVLASVLAQHKQLHVSRRLQDQRVWQHRETTRTEGTSALVIGTGGIGRATARLLRAVGVEVTGAGRTARADDPDFGTVVPTVDLAAHVGDFDTVVAIAPLTSQTERMIDATVLRAMRPDAHLVNVGRGQLVDEPALIAALQQGEIGAASLDVFTDEPLDPSSPFWAMDNVAISAHMSGDVVGWRDVLADQFLTNLRRYLETEGHLADTLGNVVDKDRGYVVSATRTGGDSRL
ncbi:D-2-hydroxyacid dehydrogenase [Gordonia sp. HNM0687]|uniref:D-2-hydroxyacid dehydrogenase n=1 Tax=Gordonia mangrovi TaxID=2665643 RepID=A0A6L7GIY1_9ACTN|nr:D-2-hydroxyacid dehydrogenase [Gordonia mangrovi]MXP19824.1 D-2-hydroxyacid dehydrogenase [Gordonia mangrovi]UVF79550.1 D-2-hydroxyacid dehydrogenase [Gordonia mangrovi]